MINIDVYIFIASCRGRVASAGGRTIHVCRSCTAAAACLEISSTSGQRLPSLPCFACNSSSSSKACLVHVHSNDRKLILPHCPSRAAILMQS